MPSSLVCGLYWDVTDGVNIDLDASAVMLDANLNVLDIVFFQKLASSDGAVRHGGDEREGDEKGDDEKIFFNLARVHSSVAHIFLTINSYSGQELDDVKDAGCHLFDGATGRDLARFGMTNMAFLDKHTALLVGDIYRDPASGDWALEIAGVAANGRVAQENVPQILSFLRSRPQRTLPPPRMPPGGGSFMMRGITAAGSGAAPPMATAVPAPLGAPPLPPMAPVAQMVAPAQPMHMNTTALASLAISSMHPAPHAQMAAPPPPMGLPVHPTALPPMSAPVVAMAAMATATAVPVVATPMPDGGQVGALGRAVPDAGMGHLGTMSAAPPAPQPPPPPAAPPSAGGGRGEGAGSVLAALQELKSMLDMGLVSQAEFDAKKAELLRRM